MIHQTDRRAPARRERKPRRFRYRLEPLEERTVLSTTITPSLSEYLETLAASAASSTASIGPEAANPTPASTAVSPAALLGAYGFSASPTAGLGTTIAIVGAYDNPTIQADLAAFSSYYHLAAASLTVVNQNGQSTSLPRADSGWSLETAMDVEWAHAVAPGARIVLVEAASSSAGDLMTAVQTAARMANVVSMSWGGGEWSGETAYDSSAYFGNSNVTFVAAAGDDGGASGASWPASSPYVLSVGGTTLSANSAEAGWSASGSPWSGYTGGGGGASRYESLPSFQATALGSSVSRGRVTPDVASDANPATGVAVYSTASGLGKTGWFQIGGTSAGAPVWAGLIANADQARLATGRAALGSSQTLSLLYSLYGTTSARSSSYAAAFHDVTVGSNFAGNATTGFDLVTGLGSPNASAIISAATSYAAKTTAVATPATTPIRIIRPRARVRAHDVDASATTDATATASAATQATTAAVTVLNVATAAQPIATVATPAAPTATPSVATSLAATITPPALPNQSVATAAVASRPTSGSQEEAPPQAQPHPAPAPAAVATPPASTPETREEMGETKAPAATDAAPARQADRAAPAVETEAWDRAIDELAPAAPAPVDPNAAPPAESTESDDASPRLSVALGLAALLASRRRATSRFGGRRRAFRLPVPSRN